MRMTMAQALVHYLANQFVERDSIKNKFISGMWGIFGHGNVAGIGEALEQNKKLREPQVQALEELEKELGNNTNAKLHLKKVINSNGAPSTNVGVTRLIGPEGVISELDALNDGLNREFLEKWDEDYKEKDSEHFTEIEKECAKTWEDLEELIEKTSNHEAPDYYHALRRWSSNFLLHFGILLNGVTSWSKELDEFIEILKIIKKTKIALGNEEKEVLDSEFKSTAFNLLRLVPIVSYRIGDTEVVLKASADLVFGYGSSKNYDRNTRTRRSNDDYRFAFSGRAGVVLYDAVEYEAYYSEESNISDGTSYTEMGNQIKLNFRNLDSRNLRQSSIGVGYQVMKNDIGRGPVFEERGIVLNVKLSWGGSRYSN